MRNFLISIIFIFLNNANVHAETKNIPGIENTINGQMTAFLENDFDKAFTFASPNIKILFKSPKNFGKMVKAGYPMVWRHKSVKFMEIRLEADYVIQTVFVRDLKGNPFLLEYSMVELSDGWKIAGVRLVNTPSIGA